MAADRVVLAGVDGSGASFRALEWAAQEARRREASLRIVCAYNVPAFIGVALDGGFAALDDTAIRVGVERMLEQAAKNICDVIEPTTELVVGDATSVLVAGSEQAELVVVGTRGRGGFAERLLGAVSSALPAHAHCPVAVVPQDGGSGPYTRQGPIVVGVDTSPESEVALQYAVNEAELWDVGLEVVTGVPLGHLNSNMVWCPNALDPHELFAEYESRVDALISRTLQGRAVTFNRTVRDGAGAAVLAELSTRADLVVVGSRGRGGFTGMLLGSTSQSVLHHTRCPVLVVNHTCAPLLKHDLPGPSNRQRPLPG